MLVSSEHWIPVDAVEYGADDSILPAVGCNQLRCKDCDARVRVLPGLSLDTGVQPDADALHGAQDPQSVPGLTREHCANLYLCRCRLHVERSTQSLESIDDRRMLTLPWACAGHPHATWPLELDGDLIELDSDLHASVRALLLAQLPRQPHPAIATLPGFQAVRVYRLLYTASMTAALATAVSMQLTAADPRLRKAALGFYRLLPQAPGAQQVLALRRRRSLWTTPDPEHPEISLQRSLRLALDAIERHAS